MVKSLSAWIKLVLLNVAPGMNAAAAYVFVILQAHAVLVCGVTLLILKLENVLLAGMAIILLAMVVVM
jgi:hypothetical protein